jgi:F0F1-type ATP synthase assembly protein I
MTLESNTQAPWWQPGLILFLKLSSWIAGPIVISLFLGRYLDKQFGTEPWIFLSLTALAFIVSTVAIVYSYTMELKRIEREENLKKLIEGKLDDKKEIIIYVCKH